MRAWLRRSLLGFVASGTFVGSLAIGAILHLELPLARRATVGVTKLAFTGLPAKTTDIRVGSIERTWNAVVVHDVDATFTDAEGRPALTVRGATGKVSYLDLGRSFLASGNLDLVLEDVHARSADVSIDDDGQTFPRVARAFVDPVAAAAKSSNGRAHGGPVVTLRMEGVVVDHVWVHGVIAGVLFDGDVDTLSASLDLERELRIRVHDADVTARALPRPTRARVRGLVVVPHDTAVELDGIASGTFGGAYAEAIARGSVERLDGVAFAEQDGGTASAIASMWLPRGATPLHARVLTRTNMVPLRVASPDAPDGTITATSFAALGLDLDGDFEARGWVHSKPTIIAHQPVPEMVATFSGRHTTWRVDALAHDDGLDVVAGLDIHETRVAADIVATLVDLSRVGSFVTTPAHGAARAHVVATGDLDAKTADGTLVASAWGATLGPARADAVDLHGHVNWRGDHGVADATAVVRRGASRLDIDARALQFGTGGLTSGRATLRAHDGQVDAAFASSQHGTRADATIARLQARDLTPFFTRALPIQAGFLGGTASVRTLDGVVHGSVHARADGLDAIVADQRIEGATVVLDAALDDHDASFFATAILDGEGAITASSDHVHIPRFAFDRASLLAITGRAQLDANATFACLRAWFGDRIPSAVGTAEGRIVYEHHGAGTLHVASFEVETNGAAVAPPIGQVAGIDALVGGVISLDDLHADLGAELRDSRGALVVARIATAFDAPIWDLTAIADLARWKRTPATVHLEVPERDISTLPSQIRPTDLLGRIAAVIDLQGTALAPHMTFAVDELGGHAKSSTVGLGTAAPIDLHAEGTYDGAVLAATVASRGAPAKQLDGEAKLVLPWSAVLAGTAKDVWEASAEVRADKLALGPILAWFTRSGGSGTVSGFARVAGLHKNASASVDVLLDDVAIGKRQVGSGHVAGFADGGRLGANVTLVQKVGRLDAVASGNGAWGASLVPSLDLVQGVDGYVRASSFDVSFVRPFVRSLVPGFNAVIDSKVAIHLGSDAKKSWADGTVTLSGGRAEVAFLGDELRDVRIRADFTKSGAAKISDIEIYPASGRVNGDGDATFDGLDFQSARLHLRIPANAEIPLGIEGVPVGDLEGNVDVTVARSRDTLSVAVNVPSARLVLAPALGRSVQALEPDPHVHIGKRSSDGSFTLGPIAAAPALGASSIRLHVALTLGDDVWLKRQTDLDARVIGSVAIDIDKSVRVSGAVSVPEGTVEIQGRRFNVERALISFDGRPPADPIVQATARYDAPAGVKIFADYVGAVSNGRIFLRSEPSLPQNEIVATLVFGSPTAQVGSSRGGGGNTALQAAAFAGGYATQGLNRALDDISPIEVTTRVDTTNSQNPRPELSVRITKRISATLGLNLGVTSPGQPPDRTILQLEYQFLPQWRVRTTNGDKGSSILDFIWQYRY